MINTPFTISACQLQAYSSDLVDSSAFQTRIRSWFATAAPISSCVATFSIGGLSIMSGRGDITVHRWFAACVTPEFSRGSITHASWLIASASVESPVRPPQSLTAKPSRRSKPATDAVAKPGKRSMDASDTLSLTRTVGSSFFGSCPANVQERGGGAPSWALPPRLISAYRPRFCRWRLQPRASLTPRTLSSKSFEKRRIGFKSLFSRPDGHLRDFLPGSIETIVSRRTSKRQAARPELFP